MTNSTTLDIDTPYTLTQDQIQQFREDGYIKLKNVLDEETLEYYRKEITGFVLENSRDKAPIEERDTYSKAFLQVPNIWTKNKVVEEFVRGKRIAKIASQLLEVSGVRIYHDQALYKEAGGGFTPWHVDQFYWPLSTNKTITAWIPLTEVTQEMGPLEFAQGSQQLIEGRDLQISEESEKQIEQKLKVSDFPKISEPYDLGEVSFHYGFTFHRAGPNTTDQAREVMTIIYMDHEMKLAQPKNKAQENDWNSWCPGAEIGEIIDSPLNPVIYSD